MQQLKQKKIPVRRCVGCNAQRPKRELVRVVRSPEGEIGIDLRGKAPGRGAYLCPSAACLAKARKAKRLERTFEVPIPDGIYDRLTEEIACAEQSAKEAASQGLSLMEISHRAKDFQPVVDEAVSCAPETVLWFSN